MGADKKQIQVKFIVRRFVRFDEIANPDRLEPDTVHIYHGPLDHQPKEIAESQSWLSRDELERAARFHFEKNRHEFTLSRSRLRMLLGAYLSVHPGKIEFSYTSHGKPFLESPSEKDLQFNVSHTDGLVAFAFSLKRAVGVDVEALRKNFRAEEIGERFFSVAERNALREYPSAERHAAFFRCWTRKEAYIKARGEGLSHPLAQFDVSLKPVYENALLGTRPDLEEANRWIIWPFETSPGFAGAGAVVVDG